MKTAKKNIFISYRVQDTAGETGRLVDALKQHFAEDQLFMDIDRLEPGADFTDVIPKSLEKCDVFLAVIGPYWLGARDGKGSRINDPNDWVRLELSTALQRNIRVVPVLVDGADMPAADELPEDLQPLLKRQAHEITNKRWKYDTGELIDFLLKITGISPKKNQPQQATISRSWFAKYKSLVLLASGFLLAIIIVVLLVTLTLADKNTASENNRGNSNTLPSDSTNSDKETTDHTPLQINAEENTSQQSTVAEENVSSAEDISGTWLEEDEGETSTFILKQHGNKIDVQVFALGQHLSGGSGTIKNGEVELKFVLLGSPTVLTAALSADKKKLTGNFTMANNITEPVTLVKKSSATE